MTQSFSGVSVKSIFWFSMLKKGICCFDAIDLLEADELNETVEVAVRVTQWFQ